MRVHIVMDDSLVAEIDGRAGARGRTAYIVDALRRTLDDERRWDGIAAAIGVIDDEGHDWDADPAEWVHEQRAADARRFG
ncbi:hypothetical protein BH20ACT6_BH20ACT6_11030 [soil metagenome]